ncbi:hypothetical protein [Amycolatopsis sp. CA-126428]|uniref:hypothetical protein n=1 Tax=Amycolatopsis sp. CA-126428 TaxID=2073158 RepID=UPI001E2EB5AA|nr:hypothetical protein [Amycolatopsis sp. CA-126428]
MNEFLESVLTSIHAGIIVIDSEMRIKAWNRQPARPDHGRPAALRCPAQLERRKPRRAADDGRDEGRASRLNPPGDCGIGARLLSVDPWG